MGFYQKKYLSYFNKKLNPNALLAHILLMLIPLNLKQ